MPNSLAANKGKPGYDEDGVRRLIVRPDGSYPTWETWKTLELWMRANGCEELDGMWSGPDADYERYDPNAYRETVDRVRYETEDLYRDGERAVINDYTKRFRDVVKQGTKGYDKMLSLIDETLDAQMRKQPT